MSAKSKDSGVLLGEVLEIVVINGVKEYVVQFGTKRFFVKQDKCIILRK